MITWMMKPSDEAQDATEKRVDVMSYPLSNSEIQNMGAYTLNRPPKDGECMSAKDEKWKQYKAYFVRDWPLGDEVYGRQQIWRHAEHPKNWHRNFWHELEKLERSIRWNGLQNPLLVSWRNNQFNLHPGKCRAFCLINMGIHTAPAIVTWHEGNKPAEIEAEYEIRSVEQLQAHFCGDIAPEMTRRGIRTPKLRD